MRKHYIDNLRIICILLLFPFHSAMCFNSFGELFYVKGEPSAALSQIVVGVYPWWMSLLFALAGISSVYALKKRSAGEYAKERVLKLLIPLLFGLVILIPPQAYIGGVWNYGYDGGYLAAYVKFFTTLTDFSGNDGCFTPGNLWFILYLFLISLIALPLMSWYIRHEKKPDFSKIPLWILIVGGFVIICGMTFVGDFGGKSIGDYGACFLLGFFVLSDDKMQEKLKRYCIPLGIAWVALIAFRCTAWGINAQLADIVWDIEYKFLEWVGILATLGLGARFLDFTNGFTKYFSAASFPLYVFHQTILIFVGYFIIPVVKNQYLAFTSIVVLSFAITVIVYEIFSRISVTRFMFGIKKRRVDHD